MKYLIDCGTHFFEGLKKLNDIYSFDDTWTIYSFEANPITFSKSHSYKPIYNNLIHINAAVSIKDGYKIINCECSEDGCGEGSNILEFPPQKDTLYGHIFKYNKLETRTYDLSSFILNLSDIDFLVLKMDIEGEEYSILPQLLNSNIKINDIYIEFHERFFKDIEYYNNLNSSLISQLKNNGTKVIVWY
jgi:FkbM family methyltransferase